MNLIYTKVCGEISWRYAEISLPTIQAYAKKCGAQLYVQYHENNQHPPQGYQKWIIKDLLNTFDRVLYLDSDLIVRSTTPNLFDRVPLGRVGAVDELPYQNLANELPAVCRKSEMLKFDPTLVPEFYVNSGVFLVDKSHRDILFSSYLADGNPRSQWGDQTHINVRLHQHPGLLYELPFMFNYTKIMGNIHAPLIKKHAYIVHYAGAWGGLSVEAVMENMREDMC